MKNTIINVESLNTTTHESNLVLLDASQHNNKAGITPEHFNLQIPGARNFDIQEDFSLKSTSLPNMMLNSEQFEKACRKIGINESSKIVVYDNIGIYFSARVWWMFRTMGHNEIYVLDGGLPKWISKGFKTESRKTKTYQTGNFKSSYNPHFIRNFDFIKKNLETKEYLLIDARSKNRFQGKDPEPRNGIESGNIPFSINLPFNRVLKDGKFKSKEELIQIFNRLGINKQPLIFSCGSGITACIILLACEIVNENDKSIYDGSWTEWAERTQKPTQEHN